ncbi:6-phospho-beta-glucosidase [Nonomuraea aurantiaca]|uniref:6-phospho-beta-glucosidase n=1 Tax=Nonomuraea aurantiaca TaxID=2878562 RepID=UPI001CD9DEFE|nr:6-phospho-beta-glucosidase [Nonomuraea aurantiaca]MCA2226774.1 6-phospho-beta-glucosidase [Nonomuraea aurantiaca]
MKLTIVGGGSTYTPELVSGIADRHAALDIEEIALVDPDTERLEVVGEFARRLLDHAGHPAKVRLTADLESGADGAAAVLLQLRVGGQAARVTDESVPLECGCVGQETTGAGGLAKALRTVPVVLDIAERVRRIAGEKTWIVDFTNPVGIVTRALLNAGHRAVGLCNVAITFERWVAERLGVAPETITLEHAGLNHLTWVRAVRVDGVDVLPRLLSDHADQLADHVGLPVAVMRRLGAIPSYYLKYYYRHDAIVADRQGPSRAETVSEIEHRLLQMYRDPSLVAKPALLEQRGGAYYSEAAVRLVASLLGDKGDVQVVNTRNGSTLPFLPEDAVVEVPARITGTGPAPLPVAPLPPAIRGLVAHVSAYESLALEAALHGGRDRVFDALMAHPLIGQIDQAATLADRLVSVNRDFLPWAAA